MTLDLFTDILNDLADELPAAFFQDLNLGVTVADREKRHEKGVDGDLFILGEYQVSGAMGRGIVLYYRSFLQVHGHLPYEQTKRELRKILRHEFRHHVEHLGGQKDLELEDERDIQHYLEKKRREKRAPGD